MNNTEKSLMIKLNTRMYLFIAIFASVSTFIMYTIIYLIIFFSAGFILSDFLTFLIMWLATVILSFIAFLILFLFNKKYLYIGNDKIVERLNNKTRIEITWEQVEYIKYDKLKWWHVFTVHAWSELQIKMNKENPYSKPLCNFLCVKMSYKDAQKVLDFYENIKAKKQELEITSEETIL